MKYLLIILMIVSQCQAGLVAHWKLDEQADTSNTGTWAGTDSQALTPKSAPINTGLLFDLLEKEE